MHADKADQPRVIKFYAQTDHGDFHSVGLDTPVQLSSQWSDYTFSFKTTGAEPKHVSCPQFLLGSQTGTISLAAVSLTLTPPGTLLSGATPPLMGLVWQFRNFDPGVGSLRQEGTSQVVTTASTDGVGWHVQLNRLNSILPEGQPVRRDYDLILIDCPPSLGIFTTNALFAADFVLIPVEAANYAVAGLTAIIDIVNGVRRNGQDVSILGIFNTRVAATNAAREAMENTKRLFSSSYIDIPIQVSTASENAVREGRPLVISDPKHKLSQAYREIAHEVLRRAKLEDRPIIKTLRSEHEGSKVELVLDKASGS